LVEYCFLRVDNRPRSAADVLAVNVSSKRERAWPANNAY
jgi:hypothetical protein